MPSRMGKPSSRGLAQRPRCPKHDGGAGQVLGKKEVGGGVDGLCEVLRRVSRPFWAGQPPATKSKQFERRDALSCIWCLRFENVYAVVGPCCERVSCWPDCVHAIDRGQHGCRASVEKASRDWSGVNGVHIQSCVNIFGEARGKYMHPFILHRFQISLK